MSYWTTPGTTPDATNVILTNASRYDRLRVQSGGGANAGKFRAIMTRVPVVANSTRIFSGWYGTREEAEAYLDNLAKQIGPAWIKTEQNEFINFDLFDDLEVRQGSGANAGQWKAYATRVVAGVEEIEDISGWKGTRSAALAAAEQVGTAISQVQLLRISGAVT